MVFRRLVKPEVIDTLLLGKFNFLAIISTSSSLALPFDGGEVRDILNTFGWYSEILTLDELGTTFTLNTKAILLSSNAISYYNVIRLGKHYHIFAVYNNFCTRL